MSSNHLIRFISLWVATLSLFVTALSAEAAKNKGKSSQEKHSVQSDRNGLDVDIGLSATLSAGISFGDARNLAVDHHLTGSKPLPPGIRKNLARGKPMPPGIAKTRMPDSFIHRLPHHEGHEWLQAGGDLVLVVSGSLVISDILEGVFD